MKRGPISEQIVDGKLNEPFWCTKMHFAHLARSVLGEYVCLNLRD